MIDNLKLEVLTGKMNESYDELKEKLKAHNAKQCINYKPEDFIFTYKNKEGSLVAGLYGYTSLGRMFVDLLWVDENYRGQGLGTKLLKLAEERAKELKLLYIRVNTGSFQAPEFYEKHGYELLFKLPLKIEQSKMQHSDYYYIKHLET